MAYGSAPEGMAPERLSAPSAVSGAKRGWVVGPPARLLVRPTVELGRLLGPLRQALARRRWSSLSLAGVGSALTVACAVAERLLHNPPWLTAATAERASLPVITALERLPGSLFAPTQGLPLWAAVAQLAVAAALAQIVCGAARAVGVGLGAHVTATLVARLTLAVGPLLPLAMPAATRFVLDTGPSAAALGLAAYVFVRMRCGALFTLLAAEPVIELYLRPTTLAAHEHFAAVAIGAVVAVVALTARPGRMSRTAERPGSCAGASTPSPRSASEDSSDPAG
jgi:hypothetical protein